ncbi:hypothetical protein EC991_009825 [Linnemannia zychae]|nr:hypothetical protein EC991_009825 [Linnemannia zychae]
MGKPSTPIFTRTRTRSSAAATTPKQQTSLSHKVLGSAAAAHGKGRTSLTKLKGRNTKDAQNGNTTTVNVSDPILNIPVNNAPSDIDIAVPTHDPVPIENTPSAALAHAPNALPGPAHGPDSVSNVHFKNTPSDTAEPAYDPAAVNDVPINNVPPDIAAPSHDPVLSNVTSDIDTVPVHEISPEGIVYFEDVYAHLRVFKPKAVTVAPHPNANSKGEWKSIKGLFQDQAAAITSSQNPEKEWEKDHVAKVVTVPVNGQDSDSEHGFNDDGDFTDALNDMLENSDFDDIISTTVHDAYQNGTINSDRPPIVGMSSVALGKRKQMFVEEETDKESEAAEASLSGSMGKRRRMIVEEEEEGEGEGEEKSDVDLEAKAAPSSTASTSTANTSITSTSISTTNGAGAVTNASSSNPSVIPTPIPTSKCMCTKCECGSQNPVTHHDSPSRPFGIKRAILDACVGRCKHMEQADNYAIGMRLCVWNDAAEFDCLRCLGQSRTAVCLSRSINIAGALPLFDCCPLVRSARRNRHLRNYFPKCYEAECKVCPPPLRQKGPPIDPRCWTVVLERRRIDFYLRCQFATAEWQQKAFADSCRIMDKMASRITKSYPYLYLSN